MNDARKNTETLIDATAKVRLEINTRSNMSTLISRHHKGGETHNIMTDNRSFQTVVKFKYFRTTLTRHEEIKSKLISTNSSYHQWRVVKIWGFHSSSNSSNFWAIPPYSLLKSNRILGRTCSSETSADFQRYARCYIPEDRTLQLRTFRPFIWCLKA
jgi:hypothetical protein